MILHKIPTQPIFNKCDIKLFTTTATLRRSALPMEEEETEEQAQEAAEEERTEDQVEEKEIKDELKEVAKGILKKLKTPKNQEEAPTSNVTIQQLDLEDTEIDEKQPESWAENPISIIFYQRYKKLIKILIDNYKDLGRHAERRLQQLEESHAQRLKESHTQRLEEWRINSEKLQKLQEKFGVLDSEYVALKKQQKVKKERSEKRKNRVPQSTREIVTEREFGEILRMIEQNNFVASRKKGAILLLYVTGLRISHLLKIKIQNMQQLLETGETFIKLTKKSCKEHPIRFSARSANLVKQYTRNFSQLMIDKENDDFLFTTQNRFDKPINRSSFDTEINRVLIQAGYKFKKHIRSHSFRTTIIRDFLESTAIDVVQEIVGHKNINATLQYRRKVTGSPDVQPALERLDEKRSRVVSQ